MKINVTFKTIYRPSSPGPNERVIYPVCENAKRFAEIAGSETLTLSTLALIEAIGIRLIADGLQISFVKEDAA